MSRILVDADCVCVDFNVGFVEIYADLSGDTLAFDAITEDQHENMLIKLGRSDLVKAFGARMRSQGFCASLPPIEGAREALAELRHRHEVHFVTRPLKEAPYWKYEREQWLIREMDAHAHDITFTHKKNVTAGHALIDDGIGNLRAWYAEHMGGIPLLYPAPHNAGKPNVKGITRVTGWAEILGLLG